MGSVVAAAFYFLVQTPGACYRRALPLLKQNPAECERLAEQAVMKAHGDYPSAQLLQCRALGALGEWDAALGGFSLIKNTTECPPDSLLDFGEKALEANQLQLADRVLRVARVSVSDQTRTSELLVRLSMQLKRPDAALALCREWQRQDPDSALPLITAADIEAFQTELGSAIADYTKALQLKPSRDLELRIRGSLANLLVYTGDLAAARTQFDAMMKTEDPKGKHHLDYVQLLRMEGRFSDSLQEINRYIDENGNTPEAMKRRGQIRMDLGQLDNALEDLKIAVMAVETDIAVHHLLAQAFLRKGQPKLAMPHLEKSRRLTDAQFRISELKELMREDPTNEAWASELQQLGPPIGPEP